MARPKTARTIASEIERSFRQRKQQIEESMEGLDKGSRAYLDRQIALAKLERDYRDERARRGLDPQNLGAVTQVQYVFRATAELQEDTRDAKRKELERLYDEEFGFAYDEQPEPPSKKSGRKK